jgi:diguanylate cyclase (GGDEF)-like protein/PAS domain S-box-containing protein
VSELSKPVESRPADAIDFDPRRHERLLGHDPAAYVELVRNIAAFGIYLIDREGVISSWNLGARNITGLNEQEVIGRPYAWLFGSSGRLNANQMLHSARVNRHHRAEPNRIHKHGRELLVHSTLDAVRDENGEITGFVEVFHDITEQKLREQALFYRATRDTLTGALNRGHFTEIASQEIERAQRFLEPLSLVMLDIDHFKTINDTWGHPVGDKAIVACAQACQAALRRIDSVGRVGGEEFAILLPRANKEPAYEMACRLRLAIATQRIESPGGSFGFTASLGVATLHSQVRDLQGLMRNADAALYQAKRGGRNRVEVWFE